MCSSFKVAALVLLVTSVATIHAANFLATQPVNQQAVRDVLWAQLHNIGTQQLEAVEEELRPMFTALPKTDSGTLEASTVRYALHRYFVKKHGWLVRGLQGTDGSWDGSRGSASITKDRAPAFILSLLQESLQGSGLGLHELAAFAATLTGLIHSESTGQLLKVFEVLRVPPSGSLLPEEAKAIRDAYLLTHILGGRIVGEAVRYKSLWSRMDKLYNGFNDTVMWYEDLVRTVNSAAASKRNPFVEHVDTYDETLGFVQEMGHKFGSFQNLECKKLKNMLTSLEHSGSGRVPLRSFYQKTADGGWFFSESVEYLRSFGALDETDKSHPSVVIPNYLNGFGNCLISTGFYEVCCVSECESLLAKVEEAVASPHASPDDVAKIVAAMPSDTVDAPRNLSSAMLSRLHDIAAVHRGQIPLHGRLFEQWMHHAYPRECPYPHLAENLQLMTLEEWARTHGSSDAKAEEIQRYLDLPTDNTTGGMVLPWDDSERLVASNHQGTSKTSRIRSLLFGLVSMAAVGSFASQLLRAGHICGKQPGFAEDKLCV